MGRHRRLDAFRSRDRDRPRAAAEQCGVVFVLLRRILTAAEVVRGVDKLPALRRVPRKYVRRPEVGTDHYLSDQRSLKGS